MVREILFRRLQRLRYTADTSKLRSLHSDEERVARAILAFLQVQTLERYTFRSKDVRNTIQVIEQDSGQAEPEETRVLLALDKLVEAGYITNWLRDELSGVPCYIVALRFEALFEYEFEPDWL